MEYRIGLIEELWIMRVINDKAAQNTYSLRHDLVTCAIFVILRILGYFSGEPMVAAEVGIWDNYCVKKQLLHSW